MNLIRQIENTIYKYDLIPLDKNIKLIVAVSGGPDSVTLLHLLWRLTQKKYFSNIKLYAACFDHCLREESFKESQYVKNLCNNLHIECFIKKFNVKSVWKKNGGSLEELARVYRYNWFKDLSYELGVTRIATGHTANDQAETIIMRLIRGAASGLKGIPIKRPIDPDHLDIIIIRPMLEILRKDIEKYCEYYKLNPCFDISNQETNFFRNRVRHNILPLLKRENPNIIKTLCHTASILNMEDELINNQIKEIFNKALVEFSKDGIVLSSSFITSYPLVIQYRLIRYIIKLSRISLNSFNYCHITSIVKLLNNHIRGGKLDLPNNYKIIKTGDKVLFSGHLEYIQRFSYPFKIEDLFISELNILLKFSILNTIPDIKDIKEKDEWQVFFDFEKLPLDLVWRNQLSEDKISPLGMNGSMRLSKFFINNKIPIWKRSKILLLASRNNILWVVGIRQSNIAKIGTNTVKVLKICAHLV